MRAIAARIQALIRRAAVNIGDMSAVPTPTKVGQVMTVVIFTVAWEWKRRVLVAVNGAVGGVGGCHG